MGWYGYLPALYCRLNLFILARSWWIIVTAAPSFWSSEFPSAWIYWSFCLKNLAGFMVRCCRPRLWWAVLCWLAEHPPIDVLLYELDLCLLWIQLSGLVCWWNWFQLITGWFWGWSWPRHGVDSRVLVLCCTCMIWLLPWFQKAVLVMVAARRCFFCRSALRRLFLSSMSESAWQLTEASSDF